MSTTATSNGTGDTRQVTPKRARRPRSAPAPGTYTARVRDLLAIARDLDKAVARVTSLGTDADLRKEFDAAMIAAAEDASSENLDRLADATGALRKGSPKRTKAAERRDELQRRFETAARALVS